jgi:hypothetical protein
LSFSENAAEAIDEDNTVEAFKGGTPCTILSPRNLAGRPTLDDAMELVVHCIWNGIKGSWKL